MRLALPPPEENDLRPGTSLGYAVRPGGVIVCRTGTLVLNLPAPALESIGATLRIVLHQGETFVAEDAGWVRVDATSAASVMYVAPPARLAALRPVREWLMARLPRAGRRRAAGC